MSIERLPVLLLALAIGPLGGCATTPSATAPLAECMPGLWFRSTGECACDLIPTPECASAACSEVRTTWEVSPDGSMREFTLRYSTGAGRTLSVVDEPSVGRWVVVGDDQLDRGFGVDHNIAPASCSDASASWNGLTFERAPEEITQAVEAMWAGESRVGFSY